jgi:hypothetical protein
MPCEDFNALWTIEVNMSKGWEVVWTSEFPPNFQSNFILSFMEGGQVRITSPQPSKEVK